MPSPIPHLLSLALAHRLLIIFRDLGVHESQALLDTYTIMDELGRLDNINLGVVGDLANGRTVHSLCIMMSMYENVKMYFIAPGVVPMKDEVKKYLTAAGVEWEEVDDLAKVAPVCDVLYQTRIQKERFIDNPDDYHQAKGKYIINKKIMDMMKPDAIVMHPLPRVDEVMNCPLTCQSPLHPSSSSNNALCCLYSSMMGCIQGRGGRKTHGCCWDKGGRDCRMGRLIEMLLQ